jgi:hypothetical protein
MMGTPEKAPNSLKVNYNQKSFSKGLNILMNMATMCICTLIES